MNEHDDFDRTLRGWIIDEGRGSAPPHLASKVAKAIARRNRRPTWLALAFGDGMGRPLPSHGSARRPLALLVVAGLILAIIAGAVMVAGSARRELSHVTVPSVAPAVVGSPAPSASSTTSAAADGLIVFGIVVPVEGGATGTYCTTIHTIRPDGSGEREMAGGCLAYGRASWGPTGDSIITDSTPLSSNETQIAEVAAGGGSPGGLLTLSGGFMPAFSPDGSQIAYAGLGSAPGAGGIFIAAADGTHPHRLTSPEGGATDAAPRFSPDGSRLVFSRATNDPAVPVLWIVNTDGSDLHPLTAALVGSPLARWSTDGSHLLFTGRQQPDGNQSLWTIDADGTGLTPVVISTDGRDEEGDWSPDGLRIVYRHFERGTGVSSLRVMNADGSGVRTLISGSEDKDAQYHSPEWGLPNTPRPEVP